MDDMDIQDNVLTPGQCIRPPGSEHIVAMLVEKLYGMTAMRITALNAYDDRNYHVICEESHTNSHIKTVEEHGYVLKIINSLDSRKGKVIEGQTEMMIFLNQRGVTCPVPVKNLKGEYFSLETLDESSERYAVRLLTYRPGEILHRVPITPVLLRNVGSFTAKFGNVLSGFSHPAYDDHQTLWMLSSVPKIRPFIYAVKNKNDQQLVHEVILAFEKEVLAISCQLEQAIIHGDLNEQNLLVNLEGTDIEAVIDFGDCHRTCLIFELAIAICYMMLQAGDFRMAKYVLEGFQSIKKINDVERKLLKTAVCGRICQSLVMGAYSHLHDPQNEYLLFTQKSGWALLKKLWPLDGEEVLREWGLAM